MRGTQRRIDGDLCVRRFIPAHAGNTRGRQGRCSRSAVHPRTCGEHTDGSRIVTREDGSSPHMRGTLNPGVSQSNNNGSSPHMRGTRDRQQPGLQRRRFIPAHAGNTKHRQDWRRRHSGSSPHMRGTPQGSEHDASGRRFIPAHAGNTRAWQPRTRPLAVHPRTCGEHFITRDPGMKSGGSSPHMRGTPDARHAEIGARRFIPAHAGNTTPCRTRTVGRTVHPRTCGEHYVRADIRI